MKLFWSKAEVTRKVNRKVQGVPQLEAVANPWRQEEEQKDNNLRVQNKQTNAREAHRPAISLTHICRMDFPIIIIWTSPLSILGESGVFLFHFL